MLHMERVAQSQKTAEKSRDEKQRKAMQRKAKQKSGNSLCVSRLHRRLPILVNTTYRTATRSLMACSAQKIMHSVHVPDVLLHAEAKLDSHSSRP